MSDETPETLLDVENAPQANYGPATLSQRISTVHRISISNIDINVDDIHRSLAAVNTFATKRMDKAQSILMYEITADGESIYKNLTLRELLYLINDEAEEIDSEYFERESNHQPPTPSARNHHPSQMQSHTTDQRPSLANKLFGNIPYPEHDEGSSMAHTSGERGERLTPVSPPVLDAVSSTKPFASISDETLDVHRVNSPDMLDLLTSDEPAPPQNQPKPKPAQNLLIDYTSEPVPSELAEYHSDTDALAVKSHPRHRSTHHHQPPPSIHPPSSFHPNDPHGDDMRRSVSRGAAAAAALKQQRRGQSFIRGSTGGNPNNKSFINTNNNHSNNNNLPQYHPVNTAIPPTVPMNPMAGDLNEDEIFEAVNIVRLRDLRRLDTTSNPNEEKSILIRRHAIIFAMDPIRAVVMAKRIILIVPDGADSLISILDGFMKEWVENYQRVKKQEENDLKEQQIRLQLLHQQLNNNNGSNEHQNTHTSPNHSDNNINPNPTNLTGATPLSLKRSYSTQAMMTNPLRKNSKNNEMMYIIPFEIHAYEALLMTVKELETQEFTFIHDKIQNALLYFKDAALVPIKIQSQIRQLKNDLSIMMNRVHGSRQALQYITEDDEEMALMNLTLLKKKPKLYRYPLIPEILTRHDEIEELIESYLMDFASLENKIEYVRSQIQSSEELVSLRLDTSRNELLIANTALAILSCAIAFGAYITGAFGMNLDQTIYLQPVNGTFAYVSSLSFGIMFIIFGAIYGYLRVTGVLPGKPVFPHHSHSKKKSLLENNSNRP